MDQDKKDEIQQGKNVIFGQMGYEELLTEKTEKTDEEPKTNVLDGQIDLESFEKQIKTSVNNRRSKINQEQNKNVSIDEEFDFLEKDLPKTKIPSSGQTEKQTKRKVAPMAVQESFGNGYIYKSLDEVLHESMIPYTEHVVLDRALPRVEDGLKPVQRRILYSMLELGLSPDKPYRKSARIVGDCMGKYHPHGDSSVYDAMVRMSQDFSLRETLVDGHGNFGSIDGDSAAAMRYTEARLTPLAMELLKDLEKDTVHWSFNFDDTLKEPDTLPGCFPNLLVNGASGIAVGLATNIPPHNLAEVIDGTIEYINDKKITLEQIMKIIKAPDFPTGGIIIAGEELKNAYRTGKGKIIVRAKVDIEDDGDKKQLVITELPYQTNKASLLQKIVELKEQNKDKLSCIQEIRDESDRRGMRAVIKLKKEANAKAILEFLYKATGLQVTFGINMVAIANGKPKQLGLLEILDYYVEYQREVVVRRTRYDLNVAKDRAHIVEGLLIAIKNIDEVIKIIKKSPTVIIAKQKLRERFDLSERQAQAILDMRLARLVNLEIKKLEEELKGLKQLIAELSAILDSKRKQYSVVKEQLQSIKKRYKNDRRSKIVTAEQLEEEETEDVQTAFAREVIVASTAGGTIKQIPVKNFSLAVKDSSNNLFDVHTNLFKKMSNEQVLLFTNMGNCLKVIAEGVPEAKWRDKGIKLCDFIKSANEHEYVVSIVGMPQNLEGNFIIYTKQGFVKKMTIQEGILTKAFYSIIKLKEEDQVVDVEIEKPYASTLMVSKNGMALNFANTEVPLQTRGAGGVMGINLDENDFVLCAKQASTRGAITVITDNGYAKKVPIGEYNVMARYRKGLRVVSYAENGKSLIYADYSETPCNVLLSNGDKTMLVTARSISYDNRVAKGKQITKNKFKNAYKYQTEIAR